MKKTVTVFMLLISCIAFSGCASMFTDKIKSIPVKTNPDNATISVYSGAGGKIFEGKSPCTISFDKKQLVDGKVIISMEGYKDTEILLGNDFETWGFANFCCFGVIGLVIGGGIDYVNGNLETPRVETIDVLLDPVNKEKKVSAIQNSDSTVLHVKIYKMDDRFTLLISQN